MKRRICVRSMGLGAVIMLIGLAVGAIVSPPLVAQRKMACLIFNHLSWDCR